MNNLDPCLTVADSAEPKSIDELKGYGINIIGVLKGKDSVRQGIQYVQDQRISVTKRSVNIIHEYRNYLWQTDKDGRILNVPEKQFKHSLDAISYAFDSYRPSGKVEETQIYQFFKNKFQFLNSSNK